MITKTFKAAQLKGVRQISKIISAPEGAQISDFQIERAEEAQMVAQPWSTKPFLKNSDL
jgi:phosphoribosylcarboxyaminoimidazole (NCAIR) mutase